MGLPGEGDGPSPGPPGERWASPGRRGQGITALGHIGFL